MSLAMRQLLRPRGRLAAVGALPTRPNAGEKGVPADAIVWHLLNQTARDYSWPKRAAFFAAHPPPPPTTTTV